MASVCNKLKDGFDISCQKPNSTYIQRVVAINHEDIETVDAPFVEGSTLCGEAEFSLKTSATGYEFAFPEKGSLVSVSADYSTNDNGYSIWVHHGNFAVATDTAERLCTLSDMVNSKLVLAFLDSNDNVFIAGLQNGVFADDTTIDPAANGGVSPIVFSSREGKEEVTPFLQYKPATGGNAKADFDKLFVSA